MKKLLLINPVGRRSGYLLSRFSRFPPLNLAYVAAVTPDPWEVVILDENYEPWEYQDADLVGITAFTSSIGRAYEIAGAYREKGVPVVMGGIHVSMLPQEALRYSDAVVAGEVENIWAKVLSDFDQGIMKGIYQGPQVDYSDYSILPRRDLLHPDYLWQPVQTSRGCPFECSFCSVSRYLGKKYRQRSAQSVLRELETLDSQYLVFVDDNLIGYSEENKNRALDLFNGMIDRGMNKKWWMQASMNVAEDKEVLKKASKAGCSFVFIGFESTEIDQLKSMRKGINIKTGVDHYKDVVSRLHNHGMGVLGAFIIGNDHETPQTYKNLSRFILRSGIDMVQITILTPLPGTVLMDQMERENRLIFKDFPEDWKKYRFSYLTHKTEGVEESVVYTGNNFVKNSIYSFPAYPYRMARSLLSLKNPESAFIVWKMNQALKRGWNNSHYRNNYPVSLSAPEPVYGEIR